MNRVEKADISEEDKVRIYIFKSDWKELNDLRITPGESFAYLVHHVLANYVEYEELLKDKEISDLIYKKKMEEHRLRKGGE